MGGTYPSNTPSGGNSGLSSGWEKSLLQNTPFKPSSRSDERALNDALNRPFRPSQERRTSGIPTVRQSPAVQRRLFKTPWFFVFQSANWLLDRWETEPKHNIQPGNTNGWTLEGNCNVPFPGITHYEGWWGSGTNPLYKVYADTCLAGQGTFLGDPWPPPGIAPHARMLLKGGVYAVGGGERMQILQYWTRPADGPALGPEDNRWGATDPHVRSARDQVSHYQFLPIAKPAPDPIPIPSNIKRPDPLGNDERSNTAPGTNASTKTGASNQYIIRHKPTKVGTRMKEKKFSAAPNYAIRALRILSRLKESLTELNDFLDVLLEAMPKELQKVPKRGRYPTLQEKLRHIYDNLDAIDIPKAIEEWVKNEIEDRLVGAAIDASDKVARKLGLSSNLANRGAWLQKPQNFAPFNW